jgi:photosystem II stability/assembly factor-like uncharacterized protein
MKWTFALFVLFEWLSLLHADAREWKPIGPALATLLLLCGVCGAESWKQVGPNAAYVDELLPDPNHKNIWYAVDLTTTSEHSQLFRSTNNAKSWIPALNSVRQILVHPKTSRLLVTTGAYSKEQTLQESRDFGKTFTLLSTIGRLEALAQDPVNQDLLATLDHSFNSDQQGSFVQLSTDGGLTWQDASPKSLIYNGCSVFDLQAEGITFSPVEPHAIYISIVFRSCGYEIQSSVLVTRNFGKSWTIEGSFQTYPLQFYADLHYGDRVFATDYTFIYTFTPTGLQILTKALDSITTFPDNRNHLLAFTPRNSKLVESFDGGKTWSVRDNPFPVDSYATFVGADNPPNNLFAVVSFGGIYRQMPNGKWVASNQGFDHPEISSVAYAGNGEIYAMVGYGFLYRSMDGGKDWTDLTFNLPEKIAGALIRINPANPGYIFLGQYISNNRGQSWQKIPGLNSRSIAFDRLNRNVVYFPCENGFCKSTENGFNPVKLPLKIYARTAIVDPANSNVLLFSGCSQIYKSIDGGESAWPTGFHGNDDIESCLVDIASIGLNEQYLAVDDASNIWRTVDGGREWRGLSTLPRYYGNGGNPNANWRIYAADLAGNHFFAIDRSAHESWDGAATWKKLKPQLPNVSAPVQFNDMSDPFLSPVYFATDNGLLTRY